MKLCLFTWPPRWLRERRELRGIPEMTDGIIQSMAAVGWNQLLHEQRMKMRNAENINLSEWEQLGEWD